MADIRGALLPTVYRTEKAVRAAVNRASKRNAHKYEYAIVYCNRGGVPLTYSQRHTVETFRLRRYLRG